MQHEPAATLPPRPSASAPTALRAALIGAQLALALAPALLLAALYGLAWRAAFWLGRWPEPWVDDPKFIAMDDWLMDGLYALVEPALFTSLVGLAVFPLLSYLLWRVGARRWLAICALLFAGGWLALLTMTGDLLTWYID